MDHQDVRDFNARFGLKEAPIPSFLQGELLLFRVHFMIEELNEFLVAQGVPAEVLLYHRPDSESPTPNLIEAADALVDLSYVVHGTASLMGLPWQGLWDEVQRANMAKVRATDPSQSKRGSKFDIIKPAGWTPPDHTPLLGTGPWPEFSGD